MSVPSGDLAVSIVLSYWLGLALADYAGPYQFERRQGIK